jgi:copper(I)-binding protein
MEAASPPRRLGGSGGAPPCPPARPRRGALRARPVDRLLTPWGRRSALPISLLILACSPPAPSVRAGDLRIEPGYVNASPAGDGGSAYFFVRNTGSLPDTIVSAAVAGASAAHLHTMIGAGGTGRMTPLVPAVVPAGGALALRRGEAHLMFEGMARPIRLGDTVSVSLGFARAGGVTVPLVVQPYGGS